MKKSKGCAIRNREYCGKGSAIEVRKDEYCNCLTSLLDKDCLVLEVEESGRKKENIRRT